MRTMANPKDTYLLTTFQELRYNGREGYARIVVQKCVRRGKSNRPCSWLHA
ncbi:hypothetical protein DSM100238_1044 [Bifidobacterium apri]|uniref:Uncharacterized protein n=1 Tax=Bifidobacterium apri TaxID=1769423 RepID=A0A6A2V868_9BIFI|nr:hypothetical protein DSM100238_1044 [Bifidobacterium apri]